MLEEMMIDGPARPSASLILAHGAGVGMRSDFMMYFAHTLSQQSIRVYRFNFPYMTRSELSGKRRPPDKEAVLMDSWRAVYPEVNHAQTGPVFIGGKSMGGRIASMLADELRPAGLVCLGYPFHPLGKPEARRIDHLMCMETPALICQGERDAMGNADEVAAYKLPASIRMCCLSDGDHSFKPRKRSGIDEQYNLQVAATAISGFIAEFAAV